MEWSEFARHLGRELAGLERDTILIVRERDESRHYVQAMREPDRLYAEAVSNNFLDGPLLLTLADEEVMSDAGWRPPAEPGPDGAMSAGPRNWWTELPAYATAADHGRLADVMVTALRDVQGVRRPSDLVYESFHRHGTGLIELLDFGIEIADPGRVSERRSTSAESPIWADGPGAAALAAPVPGHDPARGHEPVPGQASGQGFAAEVPDELEPRLAEAKSRGDHTTYFEHLLSADLVLPSTGPAVEDPEAADLPTTTIGTGTYIVVFTSPQALVRSGHRPDLYRRTSFSQLALGWPDPAWQLAINPGLPSEVHLDFAAVNRLDATLRALARPDRPQQAPPPAAPPAPAPPAPAPPAPAPPASAPPASTPPDSMPPASAPPAPGPHGSPPPASERPVPTPPASGPPPSAPPNSVPPASGPHGSPPPASAPPAPEQPAPGPSAPSAPAPPASAPPAPGPHGSPPPASAPPAPEHPAPPSSAPQGSPPPASAPSGPVPPRAAPAAPGPVSPGSPLSGPAPSGAAGPGPVGSGPVPDVPAARPPSPPARAVPAPQGRPQAPNAGPAGPVPGPPIPAPHGTRLWHWDGTGDEAENAVPVAVFDAIGGTWTPVRPDVRAAREDAVQAPRRD